MGSVVFGLVMEESAVRNVSVFHASLEIIEITAESFWSSNLMADESFLQSFRRWGF